MLTAGLRVLINALSYHLAFWVNQIRPIIMTCKVSNLKPMANFHQHFLLNSCITWNPCLPSRAPSAVAPAPMIAVGSDDPHPASGAKVGLVFVAVSLLWLFYLRSSTFGLLRLVFCIKFFYFGSLYVESLSVPSHYQ